MTKQSDVLIIGGGHNGLACAAYVASAGLSVTVLERRARVGGAAVTEEFFPGFRNSTASYTLSLLQPKVMGDLRLIERGLKVVSRPFGNFLPLPDGRALCFGGDEALSARELARFSARDAQRLPAFFARLDRLTALVRQWLLRAPPNLGGPLLVRSGPDAWAAARLLWQLGRLPLDGQRDLMALFTQSAGHWLDAHFETDALKAILGWDAVVGNYASPYADGSAYVLLHHGLGEVNGRRGQWGHVMGGMGRLTELMAQEAQARGVRIRLEAPVVQVLVQRGRAVGVELDGGEQLFARAVVANVGPKLLYGQLIERSLLPEDFARAMDAYRVGSGSLRINVALSELPRFDALPGGAMNDQVLDSGILLAPSLAYMDQAWLDAQALGFARAPIVEMLVPSRVDDSLAPKGAHVASLFCQQFKPDAPWDALKGKAVEAVFDVVQSYCPNFRAALLGWRAHTPLDLEREFGLMGGDIFHGRLSVDQLFSLRPVLGFARYRGPLAGLYHCGSGAHPGGGVSAAPGANAAVEIIRDLR